MGVAFAAVCIWLTVRIINRRERWAKRTLAAVIILAYPFCAGQLLWLGQSNWIPSGYFYLPNSLKSLSEFGNGWVPIHWPPRDLDGVILLTGSILALPFVTTCIWLVLTSMKRRSIRWRAVGLSILAFAAYTAIVGGGVFLWAAFDEMARA